ncbi:HTTM domain-containing protein [Streptomyces sp. NPDC058373]|uniref:HTTM domain-containing protein n=1 Tax=Streptomyces sp. NPDC058373 TaxID=3346465 RepID=UPI0036595551
MRTALAGFARGVHLVTSRSLGPYQTAVVRIGLAGTWLLFLLREFPHRHLLYGPEGPWGWSMARRLIAGNDAFTLLMWSDGRLWFEAVYALAVVASALLLVGWRTRTMSVLFMVGVLSLQNRNIFVGDGGDNVVHLLAMYLVLTRCGQVWSLDARRAARAGAAGREPWADRAGPVLWAGSAAALAAVTVLGAAGWGWLLFFWVVLIGQAVWWWLGRRAPDGQAYLLSDVVAHLVHNGALLLIMVETCLIYATAGWYKIQGSRWQDGTAVYYPLQLESFSPWPGLSQMLAGHGLLMLVVTYGTVLTQVAFPFALLDRRAKNALLVLMMAEHLAIAVLLGLPFFSLAMIAADSVFLPTLFLLWVGRRCGGVRDAVVRRARAALGRGAQGGREGEAAAGPTRKLPVRPS